MKLSWWRGAVTVGYGLIAVLMVIGGYMAAQAAVAAPGPGGRVMYGFLAFVCLYGIFLSFRTAQKTREYLAKVAEER